MESLPPANTCCEIFYRLGSDFMQQSPVALSPHDLTNPGVEIVPLPEATHPVQHFVGLPIALTRHKGAVTHHQTLSHFAQRHQWCMLAGVSLSVHLLPTKTSQGSTLFSPHSSRVSIAHALSALSSGLFMMLSSDHTDGLLSAVR